MSCGHGTWQDTGCVCTDAWILSADFSSKCTVTPLLFYTVYVVQLLLAVILVGGVLVAYTKRGDPNQKNSENGIKAKKWVLNWLLGSLFFITCELCVVLALQSRTHLASLLLFWLCFLISHYAYLCIARNAYQVSEENKNYWYEIYILSLPVAGIVLYSIQFANPVILYIDMHWYLIATIVWQTLSQWNVHTALSELEKTINLSMKKTAAIRGIKPDKLEIPLKRAKKSILLTECSAASLLMSIPFLFLPGMGMVGVEVMGIGRLFAMASILAMYI